MIDKVKISAIVESQFPGFMREDYGTFVSFVKAYYEFLENDQGSDLKTIRDLDTTLEEYIKYFKREYASNIPNILSNERFVLSNIKSVHQAKGTEEAIRTLFRLLFDTEIEIGYPSAQMLRLSDGRWKQKISIFIGVVSGDPLDILNKQIEIVTSNGSIKPFVESYKKLNAIIDNREVYELVVNLKVYSTIQINDQVKYGGIFVARIVPTISSMKIVHKGLNFRAGEIYEILDSGTIFKITKVNDVGQIISAEIINYGLSEKLLNDFTYKFISKFDELKNLEIPLFDIKIPGIIANKDIGVRDTLPGYLEFGIINNFDYNVDPDHIDSPAIGFSYAGELVRTFRDDNTKIVVEELESIAWLEVYIGSVSKYPGYWTSNNGFLDDSIYIQNDFYQIYSYVIRAEEKLETYKSALKMLLHPVGTALFGEYYIQNDVDLSKDLQILVQSLLIFTDDMVTIQESMTVGYLYSLGLGEALEDAFTMGDSIPLVSFTKLLVDALNLVSDLNSKSVEKSLTDTTFTIEDKQFEFVKSLRDHAIMVDSGITIFRSLFLPDSFTTSDNLRISNSKKLEDSVSNSDDTTRLTNKVFSETSTVIESKLSNFGKQLIDIATASEDSQHVFGKELQDEYTMADDLPIKVVGKRLVETQIIDEVRLPFVVGKRLLETTTTSDSKQLVTDKAPFTDELVASDGRYKIVTKRLTETLIIDNERILNFSKILTDSAEVLDFDVAIVGDGQIFATNKGFIDTISLGDNSLYILNKDLTETLESTDYNQFVFSTYKYDVQDVIDDGKLHKNPYLEDMSTFAEDGGEDYMVGKTAF